ncbi:MAG: hypothetical protein JXA25_15980 [Anaerolineales bacterium]|nr:hypothetical protein [Anaerolineales bacterium]
MSRQIRWICCLMVLVLAGCNEPTREPESPTAAEEASAAATETATEAPSPAPPTFTSTPEPTATATATATFTPAPPQVKSNSAESRCYFGPGTDYSVEGALTDEAFVPVLGRDEFSRWVQIAHPIRERIYCWLPIDKVFLEGDLQLAPYVPDPVPFVSVVSVSMSPDKKTIPCGTFPFTFDVQFSITVTGPTTVEFQRVLSNGSSAPKETHTFSTAGTETFSDYYRVGEVGTPWFRVNVLSPNSISGEDSSKMKCN